MRLEESKFRSLQCPHKWNVVRVKLAPWEALQNEFCVSYLSEISLPLRLCSMYIKILCMACELLLWGIALLM
jgi:hypothetical protein